MQWGYLSIPYTEGGTFSIPLHAEILLGLYGNIVPAQSTGDLKSNNVVIDFTSEEMNVVNWQGGQSSFFRWYLIGEYSFQQWGLSTGRTITYPISLLVLYSIVALDAASGMDAVQVCDVNTADNTNAIIFQMRLTQGDILPDNMTGFYWMLIGKAQQWGDTTVSMPLFPAEAFNIAIWDDSNATHVGFDISSLYGRYFICSKQQWGLTEEAYLPTIDFPVSFTSIPAVVGTPIKDYATSENYFGNNSIESVTVSSFVPRQTNTNGGTKAGAIRYIAVGY